MSDPTPRGSSGVRRAQAIEHAADLLREGGPNALTSVAVAERMGLTQSAVYRHIRDMDELATLASREVVDDLNSSLRATLLAPDIDWEHLDDVGRLCRQLATAMFENRQAFETVDRWHFVGGELGAGIVGLIDEATSFIAFILESRFRIEFRFDAALTASQRNAQQAHAELLLEDGYAVARMARSPRSGELDEIAELLKYRIIAGWTVYVIDMHDRLGLPLPHIDLDEGVANA
jgi:AcrR family transcriptional regulator